MPRRLEPTWVHDDRPAGLPTLDALLTGSGARVIDGDVVLDGDDLDVLTTRLAGHLRIRGSGPGDTIAFQSANRWEAVVIYRACWRIGAVAAPIHHLAGRAEVKALLGRLDPADVLEPEDVSALLFRLESERPDPQPPRTFDANSPNASVPVESSLGSGTGSEVAPPPTPRTFDANSPNASVPVESSLGFGVEPTDLAVVLHTSGSSGEPKGVLHDHAGLAYKAQLMIGVHELTRDDVILMPAPLAHVSGLQNAVTVAGAVGMTTVLMAKWDPEDALDLIERHGVTFMIGPPTFFVSLRGARGFRPERVSTIRLISCGGAGVTPAFVAATAEAFGATVKRTYGSTEAPTVTTSHATDDADRARETDGRPTGPVELRLGEHNELEVRGPELFVGYTDPARTAEAVTDDGWFRTGDVGQIDDDGWLTIVGRIKDVIIRGGENISAAEIEGVLESHRAIRQAVAVGKPDERLGETVCAFVVCAPGESIDQEQVKDWFAAQGIAKFKTPETVIVVDELPLLPAGKVDRAALRVRAGSDRG